MPITFLQMYSWTKNESIFFSISAPNAPLKVRLQEVPPNSLTVSWETLVPNQSSLHFDVQVTNITSGENIFYKNLVSTSKLHSTM